MATTRTDGRTRNDPVAIVTGGSGGFGREVARMLAGRGYSIIVYFARNQGAADAAVEEILATNGTALTVRGRVADELDVERLFAEASKAFGGVDVVVHTVGRIAVGPAAIDGLATLAAHSPTSVRGTFVVNRQAARELRDGGAIVNLFGPVVGLASPARAAYAASEGAAEAITRVVAGELRGRDITVNAVVLEQERPSFIIDVVDVVAFLASEAGHGVNGQVIRLNGGLA